MVCVLVAESSEIPSVPRSAIRHVSLQPFCGSSLLLRARRAERISDHAALLRWDFGRKEPHAGARGRTMLEFASLCCVSSGAEDIGVAVHGKEQVGMPHGNVRRVRVRAHPIVLAADWY